MKKSDLDRQLQINPFLKLGDWVYERLRADILTLKILPGTKINESGLAAGLGISRSPVRDAINRLIEQELILKEGQKLPVVAPVHKRECRYLYEARTAFEGYAAYLAAKRISKPELKLLRGLAAGYEASIKEYNVHTYAELDHEFHYTIIKAARNPRLMEMYESIEGRIFRYRKYSHIVMTKELWPHVMERAAHTHRVIFSALRMGFADLARSEMEQDVQGMLHVFSDWE